MYRFAVGRSLGDRTFSTTSPDADAVDDIALFRFVSKTTGFVGSGWTGCTVNNIELAVFPAAHPEKETENIGLFVLIKLWFHLAIVLKKGAYQRLNGKIYLQDICMLPSLTMFWCCLLFGTQKLYSNLMICDCSLTRALITLPRESH